MKISGPGQVSNVAKSKNAGKAGGDGSFAKFLESTDNEKEIHSSAGLNKISGINFIVAVDGDEKSRRRKLREEGDDILDELENIRDALLMGNLSIERLRGMQLKIQQLEANCDDPGLNDIIDEIKTRAAVELAKLGF